MNSASALVNDDAVTRTANSIAKKQREALKVARDEITRRHIREIGEAIFATQGYSSTKMQDIAKAAGMSLNTLYQSYPGKAGLHRSILIARDEEMFEAVLQSGQPIPPPGIEALLAIMRIQLSFLLNHPNYLLMQLQEGRAWYHAAARPSDEEQALWQRGLSMMAAVFDHGMTQGWFFQQNSTEQARMMLALQQARLSNWVAAGMQQAHDEVIAAALADFVRQFCAAEIVDNLLTKDRGSLRQKSIEAIGAVGF